eukprot:gene11035-12200_t
MDGVLYSSEAEERQAKKSRSSSTSSTESLDSMPQHVQGDLEWDTVKEIFERYDLTEGDNIPCFICGTEFASSKNLGHAVIFVIPETQPVTSVKNTGQTQNPIVSLPNGKHYKSRVCVKKHLWEHSLYWDLFEGLNKQQRVLSIQAAIILSIKSNPSLSVLLVTSSNNSKKKDKKESENVANHSAKKDLNENRKRKRKPVKSFQNNSYLQQRMEFVET